MDQEKYPQSDMPIKAEKRPEELSSQQVADIIEAWDEAHKVRKEYIGDNLWQKLSAEVSSLQLLKGFDPSGESDEIRLQLQKLEELGKELKNAEQRFEQVKEGKKFIPVIAKAVEQLKYKPKDWLNFWKAFGVKELNHQSFGDLGRYVEHKFGPPVKKLIDNRFLYKVGSDIWFIIEKGEDSSTGGIISIAMSMDPDALKFVT